MAGQVRRVTEAQRRAAQQLREVGEEIRRARLAGGMPLREVAQRIGCQRQRIARIEAGGVRNLPLPDLAAVAAVVGLRLSLRAFPHASALRDVAQLGVTRRFVARLAAVWRIQFEAAVTVRGDLRAFDMILRRMNPAVVVCVEVITRLTDAQAQLRAIGLKWRDAAPPRARLVVVLADTMANRRALALVGSLLADELPLDGRAILPALAEGRDPGGNGIVFV